MSHVEFLSHHHRAMQAGQKTQLKTNQNLVFFVYLFVYCMLDHETKHKHIYLLPSWGQREKENNNKEKENNNNKMEFC